MKLILIVLASVLSLAAASASAETLQLRLDKAEILRLAEPAAVMFVGNPDVADVTVERPTLLFLIGKAAGETNLLIFDQEGELVVEYDLIVMAEHERHVTVNRATDLLTTFNCDPRCIEVSNPSDIERQRQFAETDDEESGADPLPGAAEESDVEISGAGN